MSKEQRRVLIHAPNLSTPGGKQTYYTAVRKYFKSEISFFFYGSQGIQESKYAFIKRMLSDYRKFYRKVKREDFDVVLLNPSLNMNSFFRDSIFAFLCRIAGVKMIVFWRGWNWDFERQTVSRILPYLKMTYGKAASMILLAEEFRTRLREYGYLKEIYLETTTVDDAILNYSNNPDEDEIFVENAEDIGRLFLARVEENKGIYETIDSFIRLQKKYPNLVLNIAGTGGELENAKQYAKSKGVNGINFTGWISGRRKANLLHQSQIYVFPSYHGEGMPNSLLEALASGLSVVTTDVGGVKDFFDPSKMGRYIQPKNTDDLEFKLEELISRPDVMKSIKRFNRDYARKHFAPVHVAKRLENIYEETLAGKQNRPPSDAWSHKKLSSQKA
jgi:glycosyltransferase involved in cell wall biosynthesis